MFRHQGKSRTFSHNLRIATLLSFVAGVVNVTGILEIQVLTTNVTGHFAYFSEQIMEHQYLAAFAFFVFILFFLLGAFTSNFIVELVTKTKPEFSHVIPLSIEIFLLFIGIKLILNYYYIIFNNAYFFELIKTLLTNFEIVLSKTI